MSSSQYDGAEELLVVVTLSNFPNGPFIANEPLTDASWMVVVEVRIGVTLLSNKFKDRNRKK